MNPNSTGRDSIEDDIEMIDIQEVQQFHPNEYKPVATDTDFDDDLNSNDDGNTGLLSGSPQKVRASAWIQVRSIVIEVSRRSDYRDSDAIAYVVLTERADAFDDGYEFAIHWKAVGQGFGMSVFLFSSPVNKDSDSTGRPCDRLTNSSWSFPSFST